MPRTAESPEKTTNTKAGKAPFRDVAMSHSSGMAANDMMIASRPRTHDLLYEPIRARFEIGDDDGEESQYLFKSSPSGAITSSTAVHMSPIAKRNQEQMKGNEEVVQCEITQSGVKFKGIVKGVKITATQVVSRIGQQAPEHQETEEEQQDNQPHGQEKKGSGFINQIGARFSQSVTDTDAEMTQSVGGRAFYIVQQDAAEFEGDTIGGSFKIKQHVW